ncbi:MAG: CopG family transcriptional regulator [Halanaerobium sp. 4-GBenrich]|uniref:CopG family transcriptional regulator / antitoxin EndoAI n=1 Tax=Halanaerobium congolense TaxID=54121 RepID=A0A1G6Q375_9FIRM|nr:CopG family transcriptional regulator [Halanaerobium congolense]KXS49649.1 MAG: CopG family transcriptional regulator [Halanaerobium sp. T82-1]ODS50121.1 MAG: CopG family transcriptional regulator [Halanaerobium sp. 4-GBenrich]PUU92856.1 MAG: CopG family transcriptional regulator [Halanaerobium sp.]PTX15512.1 CopG family transcriptional regulator/antitoxin EndoAI [Halanaerobium congolense]PXV60207.1 CopG family transcriptional regulator/antitoxin EndoAI [Halanaerobium congolense]
MLLENRKISIELPECVLEEIKSYCKNNNQKRNDFLMQAIKFYLKEMKKQEVRNHLRDGYKKMAGLNQQLADEGLSSECYSYLCYEQRLVECEKIESKKG